MKTTTTFILCLMAMNAMAQNNAKTDDLRISKGHKKVNITEIGNGLLVDNYNQLVSLITKHNKVKLSQEFVKKEKEFFKDSVYYFVQIQTHCNQPELHNIIPKYVGANKIEINTFSVYSGPACPGVIQSVIYSVIIPKKYLTDKKLEVTIKPQEVFERPVPLSQILNGTWIEAEYDISTKSAVSPKQVKTCYKAQSISFGDGVKMITGSGYGVNSIIYFGNYKIENDNLTITYLGFHTADGLQKETIQSEVYKIIKLTDKELVIARNDIEGKVVTQAYLKN